jgi:hypothetical protein
VKKIVYFKLPDDYLIGWECPSTLALKWLMGLEPRPLGTQGNTGGITKSEGLGFVAPDSPNSSPDSSPAAVSTRWPIVRQPCKQLWFFGLACHSPIYRWIQLNRDSNRTPSLWRHPTTTLSSPQVREFPDSHVSLNRILKFAIPKPASTFKHFVAIDQGAHFNPSVMREMQQTNSNRNTKRTQSMQKIPVQDKQILDLEITRRVLAMAHAPPPPPSIFSRKNTRGRMLTMSIKRKYLQVSRL